jgi:hypothetical protein
MGDLEILDSKLSMSKSELLLTSLTKFFDAPENREKLHDILEHRKGISLRKLEWFVTNYAKNNHVTYTAPTGKMFTVHVAYKSSLDGYSKKLFDPFCRTERVEFQGFTTTCAQLNFLRWCIQNGVVEYLEKEALKQKGDGQILPGTLEEYIHNKTYTNCTPV